MEKQAHPPKPRKPRPSPEEKAEALAEAVKAWERKKSVRRVIAAYRDHCPAYWYEPHSVCRRGPRKGRPSGQLQFHQSTADIRVAAPGNGWGGSTAMGCEMDAWMRHTNRWQQTPKWPIMAIWFCPQYKQFGQVKEELIRNCFGRLAKYTESGILGPRFVWPDGGTMCLGSYDSDWTAYEGIEKDLIAFDEIPPFQIWKRMMMRKRGRRDTRYICKATQVQGYSWMADFLYEPWKKKHEELGIYDEEEMMVRQADPDLWLWPRGGMHDNPAVTDEQVRKAEQRRFSSEKERKVSLFGGFEQFVGDPVFDEGEIERLRAMASKFEPWCPYAELMGLDDEEATELEHQEAMEGVEEARPMWVPE